MEEDKKTRLRKKIEELLNRVPEGSRIRIDKVILEELMFDKINSQIPFVNFLIGSCKKFVWSGDFLSKIDLSQVSFEDVDWCDNIPKILRNTNARPDFNTSYGKKKGKNRLEIIRADFSGTDLSYFDFGIPCKFLSCNFTATHINISDWKNIEAHHTVFDDNDLQTVKMSCRHYLGYLNSASFRNTGIHFMMKKS